MMDLEEEFNFTNKRKHPTDYKKIVYRHLKKDQSDQFILLLEAEKIEFEIQVDEDDPRKPVYFGLARIHEKRADHLNFIALGKNRAKFIDSKPLRWVVIGLTLFILALAVIGAIVSN